MKAVYKEFMIVWSNVHLCAVGFKGTIKNKMDAAQDHELRDITLAAMGAYAYKTTTD